MTFAKVRFADNPDIISKYFNVRIDISF